MSLDLTDISTEEDLLSENCDSGVSLSKEMDELLCALDAIGDRANDSMQAAADSELLWLQTLQERDELILANNSSLKQLQTLNDQLRQENTYLKDQLETTGENEHAESLREDAEANRNKSLQLQAELARLQIEVVSDLKKKNHALTKQLTESHTVSKEVTAQLRTKTTQQQSAIRSIKHELESHLRSDDYDESVATRAKLNKLCDIYENIIDSTCRHCEDFLADIDAGSESRSSRVEFESNYRPRQHSRSSSVPDRHERLAHSAGDRDVPHSNELSRVQSLEKMNYQLRTEIANLQKDLNRKEQDMFKEAMKRFDSKHQDQIEKMRSQVVALSQELSHLSVDNRALRERLLRVETESVEKENHQKSVNSLETETKSLQDNLKRQLLINTAKEHQIKQLELVKQEHTTLCTEIRDELNEARTKIGAQESELKQVTGRLEDSRDLQKQFEEMNLGLNKQLQIIHEENKTLQRKIHSLQRDSSANSRKVADTDTQKEIAELENTKRELQSSLREVLNKLEVCEKQKNNANTKVKALRDRLKGMHDSWEKISKDTEASYTSLREQYQQQIQEYKTIIESLRTQNNSLTTRLETLGKTWQRLELKVHQVKSVSEQFGTIDKMTNLEQQLCEANKVSDEYKVENLKLKMEMKNLIKNEQRLQTSVPLHEPAEQSSRFTMPDTDEFGRLREILTAAKSDVESMQLKHIPSSPFRQVKEQSSEETPCEKIRPPTYASTPIKTDESPDQKRGYKYQPLLEKRFEPLARSSPNSPEKNLQSTIDEIRREARKEQILNSARSANKMNEAALRWRPRKYTTEVLTNSKGGVQLVTDSPLKKFQVSISSPRRSARNSLDSGSSKSEIKKQVIEVTNKSDHFPELDPNKTFKPIKPEYSDLTPTKPKSADYTPSLRKYKLAETRHTGDSAYGSLQKTSSYNNPLTTDYASKYLNTASRYTTSMSGYMARPPHSAPQYKPHTSPDYKSDSLLKHQLSTTTTSGHLQQSAYQSRFSNSAGSGSSISALKLPYLSSSKYTPRSLYT